MQRGASDPPTADTDGFHNANRHKSIIHTYIEHVRTNVRLYKYSTTQDLHRYEYNDRRQPVR